MEDKIEVSNLSVSVTFEGYDKLKEQLNDIEAQFDRISEKINKIKEVD
jgi:hypothetical protein